MSVIIKFKYFATDFIIYSIKLTFFPKKKV